MRIALFFGNAGNPGPHSSGTERYEIELARALAKINQGRHELHYIYLYGPGPAAAAIPEGLVNNHVLSQGLRPLRLTWSLPALLRRLEPDVTHATFIPPYFGGQRLVYTLPCQSPFLFPELFEPGVGRKMRVLFWRGVERARAVVCYSRSLQEWVVARTGRPAESAPVVPMAASSLFRPIPAPEARAAVESRFGLRDPYFVFSGRQEKRKNILRLIEAFALFRRRHASSYRLVLAGSRFWAAEEVARLVEQLGLRDAVIDLGRTPFEDLPLLYGAARALAFPSVWESFGLPVVEAMSCGTAVLTSNTSCLPEVAGDAALLVNPLSVESIAGGLERLATDDALVEELQAKSLARAREFSWEKTAGQTIGVYETVARD